MSRYFWGAFIQVVLVFGTFTSVVAQTSVTFHRNVSFDSLTKIALSQDPLVQPIKFSSINYKIRDVFLSSKDTKVVSTAQYAYTIAENDSALKKVTRAFAYEKMDFSNPEIRKKYRSHYRADSVLKMNEPVDFITEKVFIARCNLNNKFDDIRVLLGEKNVFIYFESKIKQASNDDVEDYALYTILFAVKISKKISKIYIIL
jgi:hypothetical protein